MKELIIKPGKLTLDELRIAWEKHIPIKLSDDAADKNSHKNR